MVAAASPQIVGRYAIYEKIASGGMASVHFGRLIGGAGFSRTVAIKRLHPHLAEDPDFLATLIDEARLAARIHHPNVVPTLDVVATDGELLLVMEYVRGEALSRLARAESARGARVPLSITSAIVSGALLGLHAAHEATNDQGEPLELVHRDVSPQNILVGIDGLPRVIDFGVAKATGRLQTTREGTIKGKIAYMAPEQLASKPVTRVADVYAMGVVLWEALAGRRLFQADTEGMLVGMVLAGAAAPPSHYAPDISPELDALVMRSIAPDPSLRFATARQMADALTRIEPPALPTDVGEWCAAVGQSSLAKRGALLADIESRSGSEPSVPFGTGSERSSTPQTSAPVEALQRPAEPSRRSGRVSRVVVAAVVSLVVVGVAVALVVKRRSSEGATDAAVRASSSVDFPAIASSPTASASAVPSSTLLPLPLPTPPSEARGTHLEAPATSSPARQPTALPAPTALLTAAPARTASPASTAKPSPPRCDPSFYFDSSGTKHFKPECFGR